MFSICIPYRYRPERDGMISACLERLSAWGYEIHVGGSLQDGKFNRAAALNEAIKASINDWIITMDVDMVLPLDFFQLIWGQLHKKNMLTFDFYEGGVSRFPGSPGGVTVFHRELYVAAGGYNETYEGYGYEDYDFRDRVVAYGGQWINTHIPIGHIAHDPVPGIQEDLKRNQAVYERAGFNRQWR